MKEKKTGLILLAKKAVLFCLILGMLSNLGSYNVYAKTAKNNVTAKYKKTVTRLLRNFDSYLGLGCKRDLKVKFNIYAKSTMAYLACTDNSIYGKNLSYVRKKLKKDMKLYFGTGKAVKFKKNEAERAYATAYLSPSNIVQNVDGVIRYVGGNWSESAFPRGYVSKILKKSSKKYEVTYRVMWYDSVSGKIAEPCEYTSYTKEMGAFRISLKKAKNKYGFVITGIKRIRANINSY